MATGTLLPSFGKKLFVLAAAVAVCFALLQVGGRLIAPHLSRFEAPLNDWLAPHRVHLSGVRGAWHGLHPVVAAERVTFPGGDLNGVTLELDLGESLWRNRIIARRFEVAGGRLRFVKTSDGWWLDGAERTGNLDLVTFFRHSDEVRLNARVEFAGAAASGELDAHALIVNRNGRNRWHATLAANGCAECALRVDLDIDDAGRRQDFAGAARVSARGFAVDAALAAATGLPPMSMQLEGRWHSDGRQGSAALQARTTEMRLPGGVATLAASATAKGYNGSYRGALGMQGETAGAMLLPPALDFVGNVGGALTLWAAELDLGAWSGFLIAALGADGAVGRWFDGVGAQGGLRQMRLHLDGAGVAYSARIEGATTKSYRGIPEFHNANGQLWGHPQAARMEFESHAAHAALPDHFERTWPYDRAAGVVTAWFSPSYLGLRGQLETELGAARSAVAIGLTRPRDALEGRLAVAAAVDAVQVDDAKRYMPRKLPGGLKPWLDASLVAGRLDAAAILYHGHTRSVPGLPMRRLELAGRVADGALAYHPAWPVAERLDGELRVSGTAVLASGFRGVAAGAAFEDMSVHAPAGASHADVRGRTRVDAQKALDFVHGTPTAAFAPYVCECWRGVGPIEVDGRLRVPLGGIGLGAAASQGSAPPEGAAEAADTAALALARRKSGLEGAQVDLTFDLAGTELDFADVGLRFADLRGQARFHSPHHLVADALQGTLFDAPVTVSAASNNGAVDFTVRGRAGVDDVFDLIGTRAAGFARAAGAFGFDAKLSVFPASERPPELMVATDGVGLGLALPAPLGKPANLPRPLRATLTFSDDYTRMEFLEGGLAGWLHVLEGDVLRGAIGVGAPAPTAARSGVTVTGRIGALHFADMEDLENFESHALAVWRLHDFTIGSLHLQSLALPDMRLNGVFAPDWFDLDVESEAVAGQIARQGHAAMRVNLAHVRLPDGDEDADPLDVALMDRIPAMDVTIEQVLLAGEHFGNWRFDVRPADGELRLIDVEGKIKGLNIVAAESVVWSKDTDATWFRGSVAAGDLAEVLPQWGYGTSVESAAVRIEGEAFWPGSPLNFELHDLSGDMRLTVDDGRFLDVGEAPGGRFLALLNFSKIAHRLQLDFSDVFGKGIGFDTIRARTVFDDGVLHFAEPMLIEGPGSEFKIYGTVDFANGSLDNDMIVTLPLSSSLPWYAIWLASTNPATAAGVLLGQQVFKNQLAALSSARYRVTGVIDDPEPKLVGLFSGDLDPAAASGGAEAGPRKRAPAAGKQVGQ